MPVSQVGGRSAQTHRACMSRLTNLKGITAGLPRSPDGARQALLRYEAQNADLPVDVRRVLALAACGRYFGRRNLELAMARPLPNYPFRDWSWRWWNVLYHSGLASEWHTFIADVRLGGLRQAAARLRWSRSREEYLLCLRRAGTTPHNNRRSYTSRVWKKAGTWSARSNFTKILVEHQHLPGRPMVKGWQLKLGNKGVQLIEKELFKLYDPDSLPPHEIKQRAVEYVRRRISDVLARKRVMGYHASAWLFQEIVTDGVGLLVPREGGRVISEKFQGLRQFLKGMDW